MLSNPRVNPKPSLAEATGSSDACCARTVPTIETASISAHAIALALATEQDLDRVILSENLESKWDEPERPRPVLPILSLQPRACGAHDHPFSRTLLEEIHPKKLAASVLSVPNPFFSDTAMDCRNIAEHLHVHRTIFKPLELVMEELKIA